MRHAESHEGGMRLLHRQSQSAIQCVEVPGRGRVASAGVSTRLRVSATEGLGDGF